MRPREQPVDDSQERDDNPLILFVDDEDSVRAVASAMLEAAGFRVLPARTAREAIELFEQHPLEIDGILLDCTMPDARVDETVDALRRIRANVPIVLTSGYPRETLREIDAVHARAFMPKPFQIQRMRTVLTDALQPATNPGPGE
jgi:CheY-like chemotaxis protein